MGSINIIKLLSTFLLPGLSIKLRNINNSRVVKVFSFAKVLGNAKIRIRGSWVRKRESYPCAVPSPITHELYGGIYKHRLHNSWTVKLQHIDVATTVFTSEDEFIGSTPCCLQPTFLTRPRSLMKSNRSFESLKLADQNQIQNRFYWKEKKKKYFFLFILSVQVLTRWPHYKQNCRSPRPDSESGNPNSSLNRTSGNEVRM